MHQAIFSLNKTVVEISSTVGCQVKLQPEVSPSVLSEITTHLFVALIPQLNDH